jgi:hypothetical protein
MKKYMILGALLFTGITFAQSEPKHEVVGDIVKSTYYHENGKVSQEGFWVRGVKIEQDAREAETVYNAFKAWMMWAKLNER